MLNLRHNLHFGGKTLILIVVLSTTGSLTLAGPSFMGLGDLLPNPPIDSLAIGCSGDGLLVVGGGSPASGREAFGWTEAGGMVGLGDLPGGQFDGMALACSGDGSVIVGRGYSASGPEAFLWTEADGNMVPLGDLPGGQFDSQAIACSYDGSVVVGQGYGAEGWDAFIWDRANGIMSLTTVLTDLGLDLTGWDLLNAHGVSDDGLTIVGWGIHPDGDREAWRAVVPEPGTPALLALGGVAVLRGRRRK